MNFNKILILTIGFTALAGLAMHQGNGGSQSDVDESLLIGTALNDSGKIMHEEQQLPAQTSSDAENCVPTSELTEPGSGKQQGCSFEPTAQNQTEKTPKANAG